jgi:hypothetical protein
MLKWAPYKTNPPDKEMFKARSRGRGHKNSKATFYISVPQILKHTVL